MQDSGEYAARVRQEYTDRTTRVLNPGVRGHPFYSPTTFSARDAYLAAENGELAALAAALVRDPSIDVNGIHFGAIGHRSETLLHAAVRRGRTDIACLLIALGADVNSDSAARDSLNSPLHEAVRRDYRTDSPRPINAEMVHLLLDSGAEANRRYFERYDGSARDDGPACNLVMTRDDIIHPAVLRTNLHVIDLLISHGLDVNMMPAWSDDARPRTFAYLALKHGGIDMLKWAVSRGAAVSDTDFDAFSRLYTEHGQSCCELEDYFIERGFRDSDLKILPNLTYGPGIRSREDFFRLVGLLLANLPEPAFEQICRALAEAVKRCDLPLVEFWLDWGVDVNAWRDGGSTLLLLAMSTRRPGYEFPPVDIIKLLLERGAEVNAMDESTGGNALHLAVSNFATGHVHILPFLLARGVDPDAKDANGDTPLLAAVKRATGVLGRPVEKPREREYLVDFIHLLAKAVKNINATDALGRTALHLLACRSEYLPRFQVIAVILLQRGVRVDARDNLGLTAGDLFQKEFHAELELYKALSGQL
ncbi:hypothetical protein RB595_004730 [Gaeumannomyces hyphopodioides]